MTDKLQNQPADTQRETVVSSDSEVERHSKKNIIFGTVLGYVNLVLSIVSGLVFIPWIIQSIGQSAYGLYTLSVSLVNLFLLDFGLSATANTFLAKYKAAKDETSIRNFLGIIYKLYLIIDVVIFVGFVVAYFLSDYIYQGLTPEELSQFKVVFLISASFSLVSFPCSVFNGIISAYEEFVFAKIVEFIGKIVYIAFTALAIHFGYGLYAIVIVNSASGFLMIVIKFIYIRFHLHVKPNIQEKLLKSSVKEIIKFSIWAALVSICSRLIFSVVPSILAIVSDSDNIAVFGIASSFEAYVYSFGSVMSGFFLPKLSRMNESASLSKGRDLLEFGLKIAKIQFVILGLFEVGFVCCGQEFITVWMKSDGYSSAYWGTIVLIAYQFVFVPEIVFHTAMYSSNKINHLAFVEIGVSLLNVGLSFLLGYYLGAFGACLSIFICRSLELVLINVCYKKDLEVDLKAFFRRLLPRPSITVVLSLTVGLLLHFYLPAVISKTWMILLVEVASICLVYLAGTFFITFSKEEKKQLFKR